MPDRSLYKVGVVKSIDELPKKGGKPLRACQVAIGDDETICVVTNAANVREDSRIVVAPVGSSVTDSSGEEMEIKKTSVGGVMSEGMFCDSQMLGWKGGAVGVAAKPDGGTCLIKEEQRYIYMYFYSSLFESSSSSSLSVSIWSAQLSGNALTVLRPLVPTQTKLIASRCARRFASNIRVCFP